LGVGYLKKDLQEKVGQLDSSPIRQVRKYWWFGYLGIWVFGYSIISIRQFTG